VFLNQTEEVMENKAPKVLSLYASTADVSIASLGKDTGNGRSGIGVFDDENSHCL